MMKKLSDLIVLAIHCCIHVMGSADIIWHYCRVESQEHPSVRGKFSKTVQNGAFRRSLSKV